MLVRSAETTGTQGCSCDLLMQLIFVLWSFTERIASLGAEKCSFDPSQKGTGIWNLSICFEAVNSIWSVECEKMKETWGCAKYTAWTSSHLIKLESEDLPVKQLLVWLFCIYWACNSRITEQNKRCHITKNTELQDSRKLVIELLLTFCG